VFTSARLVHLKQGMLDLALVSLGLSILMMVVLFLFDPKPVIPPALVALFGGALFALGFDGLLYVALSAISFCRTACPMERIFRQAAGERC
jgi:polyferredoxin